MIDKDFIEKWAPKYVYSSKFKYSEILTRVQEDIQKSKIISKDTFEKIIRWKAERNFNNVNWAQFEIYTEDKKIVQNYLNHEDEDIQELAKNILDK